MTTTPLMAMVLPDDGASFNQWGILINQIFSGRIDLHNHTTGLGAKVPTGGLNIDADLSFSPSGTPRAITDLKAIDFSAVAASAVASLAGAFFLSDGTGGLVLNELYYRTTSGSNVRITSGAALNVAAFAGAIGGDYVSVGALIDYDDASDMYRFRQETAAAVRQFAKLSSADIQLTEYKASGVTPVPATAVTLKSPAALAASYSMTMPAALPGSTHPVQMTSAGALVETGSIAMAANESVTVSGTGKFKHGLKTIKVPVVAPVGGASTSTQSASITSGAPFWTVTLPDLIVGSRILEVRARVQDSATGPTTLQLALNPVTDGGLGAAIAASSVSAGSGAAQTLSLTGLALDVAASTVYVARVNITSGTTTCTWFWLEVDVSQP